MTAPGEIPTALDTARGPSLAERSADSVREALGVGRQEVD
jgi:hypothetical protein